MSAIRILSPVARQVVQRTGFEPILAGEHEIGGPRLGHGRIALKVDVSIGGKFRLWYRTIPLVGDCCDGTDWIQLETGTSSGGWEGVVCVPAGGWHRLEVRCTQNGDVVGASAVEPVGVGEVFLIAGQSYADCCSEKLTRIDDPFERVTAYDFLKKEWMTAHDPLPNMENGGSIWPFMCNALLPVLRVPIGLVNVARNASASREWLPGEELYERIAQVGKTTGDFRAVLWQQGESDVIEKTETLKYFNRIKGIRASLVKAWGFEPPWIVAKSTLHPYVYNDPAGERMVREAVDLLWNEPGFLPGPDTDVLGGENRAPLERGGHFTGIGQKRAGLMWYASILNILMNGKQH